MIGTTTMAAAPAYGGAYGGVSRSVAVAQPTRAYAGAANYGTTAYAAPATTAYAAPANYATTAYAAPQATYAQPTQVASYVAQPQQVYAQPQQATYAQPTQVASYVAQPQQVTTMIAPQQQVAYAPQQMVQQVAPQMAMPMEPPRLTQGIPTPDQIAQQKAAYANALDKQLEQAKATVIQETKIEQQMCKFNADKNVSMYQMQVEEKRTEAEALVDEQATIQALELKKALVERNLQLDNQASGMTMDYRMKELMTQCAVKQYQFQEQYVNAENRLAQDYNAQVAKSMTGTAYAPTAAAVR